MNAYIDIKLIKNDWCATAKIGRKEYLYVGQGARYTMHQAQVAADSLRQHIATHGTLPDYCKQLEQPSDLIAWVAVGDEK